MKFIQLMLINKVFVHYNLWGIKIYLRAVPVIKQLNYGISFRKNKSEIGQICQKKKVNKDNDFFQNKIISIINWYY